MEARLKKTFICADVNAFTINRDLVHSYVPQVGDVAVFDIISLGKHLTIQGSTGNLNKIMPGDRIMAAFGHRYATEQFEGYVPEQCQQEFHILGAGGTVGWVHSTHAKFSGVGPTRLQIVGYATDETSQLINTKKLKASALYPFSGQSAAHTNVVLSVGSSMDSGKTTTAAHLVHGLVRKGKRVVFIKLTGTTYTKDCDLSYDLGACQSLDFSQFGFPSTYMCQEDELMSLYESLLNRALETDPNYVIIEIADGIFQRETKMLLQNPAFTRTVHDVIFSACDSLSAVCGVQTLKNWGIKPFALCGLFTTSPLLMREVRENVNVPVFTLEQLRQEGTTLLMSRQTLPANCEVPAYLLESRPAQIAA